MCLIGMFASASRRSLPLHQTLLDLFEGGKQTWPFTRTSKNSLLFYFFSFLDFGNTEIIQTYGTFNYNCTSVVQNNHNLPTFYQFSPKHREFSSIAVHRPRGQKMANFLHLPGAPADATALAEPLMP